MLCRMHLPPAYSNEGLAHAAFSALLHVLLHMSLQLQFVYLREAFSPSPDERIATLHAAFAVDGRLVVNYALTPAWG